jgi:hypothetical protein
VKLVIDVVAENGGTRMEFSLADTRGLRVTSVERGGNWVMEVHSETVHLVIQDAADQRLPREVIP